MNQEKIGKFIALNRKEKKLTQEELAEKLGVSKNAVSKWERGICLMDMSLLKPLSEILEISVNELLQGEYINKITLAKTEENIINTINYGEKKVNEKNNVIGIILIIFGITLSITTIFAFKSETSLRGIYTILGLVISLIGVSKIIKKISYGKRLFLCLGYIFLSLITLIIVDYINVIIFKKIPCFTFSKEYYDNLIIYHAPFYNVYHVNKDTRMEYFIVDTKGEYNKDSVPILPFNIDKTGIEVLLKYQDDIDNLIKTLPLSEYDFTFKKQKNDGLIINYKVVTRYIDEHFYVKKSILYNTIALFSLIDDLKYINYQFYDQNYYITRSMLEEKYSSFKELENKYLDKVTTYKMYVYNSINDDDFVNYYFKIFFLDEKLKKTSKIIVKYSDTLIKTITNQSDISNILLLFSKGRHLPFNAVVTSEGNLCEVSFYNKNLLIENFLFFQNGSFGEYGKEYVLDTKSTDELIKLLR